MWAELEPAEALAMGAVSARGACGMRGGDVRTLIHRLIMLPGHPEGAVVEKVWVRSYLANR